MLGGAERKGKAKGRAERPTPKRIDSKQQQVHEGINKEATSVADRRQEAGQKRMAGGGLGWHKRQAERKQMSEGAAKSGLKSRQNERQEALEANGRSEDSKRVIGLRKKPAGAAGGAVQSSIEEGEEAKRRELGTRS